MCIRELVKIQHQIRKSPQEVTQKPVGQSSELSLQVSTEIWKMNGVSQVLIELIIARTSIVMCFVADQTQQVTQQRSVVATITTRIVNQPLVDHLRPVVH